MNLFTKQKLTPQTQKTNFWFLKGKGEGEGYIRNLGLTNIHYYIKTDNQQGPTIK